jgi:predicted ABC-type ATPase
LRVQTRKDRGGHGVLTETLHKRFGRTQKAISDALTVADAAILTDNSYGPERAFTLGRLQQKRTCLFDVRRHPDPPAAAVEWLSVVSPEH